MTIALLCMVLFDMLITKSAGGHSLTQVSVRKHLDKKHVILVALENHRSKYDPPE